MDVPPEGGGGWGGGGGRGLKPAFYGIQNSHINPIFSFFH